METQPMSRGEQGGEGTEGQLETLAPDVAERRSPLGRSEFPATARRPSGGSSAWSTGCGS
jgi:hypothetical protein